VQKKERQNRLLKLIAAKRIENQQALLQELEALGVETNQATISRDLNELGIIKVRGVYRRPQIEKGESRLVDVLEAIPVGDHLIVVNTLPAQANSVAAKIDEAKFPGIVGSVAGDDTLFIAVLTSDDQKRAIKWILEYFTGDLA